MLTKRSSIEVPIAASRLRRDYDGPVFVSDIDKTYLETQIDSLGGLLRAAFESPETKSNIPGFSIILRAVRRGAGDSPGRHPLFFVSASPPQMRQRILAKMEIDGVENDGIIFKNQMSHVRSGKFGKIKEQIGYKLSALLMLWNDLPKASKIVFFGDDSESDATVYSLFSEILSNTIRGKALEKLLLQLGVFRDDAIAIAWFSRNLGDAIRPVKAVFINLETGSQPSYYSRFGSFMFPTDDSLQTALVLFELGLLRDRAVCSVGKELILQYDRSPENLLETLESGCRRGLYLPDTLDKLWPLLNSQGVLPSFVPRPVDEGAVTKLSPDRWIETPNMSLKNLKNKYSDEGRY
jgi:hypothetical protein